MSTVNVTFTIELSGDKYVVNASILSSPTSREIFLFSNDKGEVKGEFIGVVDVDQLTKYPKWTGAEISSFAVKFVRDSSATVLLNNRKDVDQWIEVVDDSIRSFLQEHRSVAVEVISHEITV